nr:ribose-phosphate diphosphokinase [Qipengyuania polymorpha]
MFTLHAADSLASDMLAGGLFDEGNVERRRFPDGESYVRLETGVEDRAVVFLCSLDRPDERVMTLLLAAEAAQAQGAQQVGLIAPYLAYMRQDKAFRPGEAVSAPVFAEILSRRFDWLVTLEPHLHRITSLDEIFTIPARAAEATQPIAEWIAAHVERPFLVGPDSESAPWIERIAARLDAPFAVLEKERLGDHEVRIGGTLGGLRPGMTPVVVDDIVSSGGTLATIVERIAQEADRAAVCIAVHALYGELPAPLASSASLQALASSDSVPHASNRIGIANPLLAEAEQLITLNLKRHRL